VPGKPREVNLSSEDLDVRDFKLDLKWLAPVFGVTTLYSIVIKDGGEVLLKTESVLPHATFFSSTLKNGHRYEVEIYGRSEMYGINQYMYGEKLTLNISSTSQGNFI